MLPFFISGRKEVGISDKWKDSFSFNEVCFLIQILIKKKKEEEGRKHLGCRNLLSPLPRSAALVADSVPFSNTHFSSKHLLLCVDLMVSVGVLVNESTTLLPRMIE